MQNSSSYDSGYYSNFSTASGPGQPPFSRGNSDIDDQVEHYIRDQRVATFANTLTDNTNQTPPTPPPPNSSYLNPYQLHIPRAIAEHQRAIANDPDADHSPPLIPDSDTEDEADTDDTDSVPPLIRLDEDNQPNVAHTIDLSIAQPLAPPDHPPCRAAHGYILVFDIRTATNDSDSTPVYPEEPPRILARMPRKDPATTQLPQPLPLGYNPNSHGTNFTTVYLT